MANLKCKYCGADVEKAPDDTLGVCSGCGERQAMPSTPDPRKIATYNAANYFRRIGKFEKAAGLYRQLLSDDPGDAEASWGCVLCKYGILFEQSGENGKYIPVSKVPIRSSIWEDKDYLDAVAHSDGSAKIHYEQEATRIFRLIEPTVAIKNQSLKDTDYLLKQAYLFLEQSRWIDADNCCDKYLQSNHGSAIAWIGKLLAEVKQRRPNDLINCSRSFEHSTNYQNALKYADPTMRKTLQACLAHVKKRCRQEETEDLYQKACGIMKNASTKEEYSRAAAIFAKLTGYRDANGRYKECMHHANSSGIDALYLAALSAAANARTVSDYRRAVGMLEQTRGWRDTDQRIEACLRQIASLEAAAAQRNEKIKDTARKLDKRFGWKRLVAITIAAVLIIGVSSYSFVKYYVIPESKYRAADTLLTNGKRADAIDAFQALGEYKDSAQRALDIQTAWYSEAEAHLARGDFGHAAASFGGLRDYSDARERSLNLWDSIAVRPSLCAGGWYTSALHADGTALAIGDNRDKQCNLDDWQGITGISSGWAHTVGLRNDGTVIAAGYNGDGRADVEDWSEIVSVSAGQWHTVGLKCNGTVVAVGCENDGRIALDAWKDIMAVSAGRNHTVGLVANRTAVAAGDNSFGQCNINSWTNLTAIAAGGEHTLGLRTDGTVVSAGRNTEEQSSVDHWEDITAVAAGYYHSVGLRRDGTVVAVGLNYEGQCNVGEWTDIIAIAAGGWHTVGLKADGTVVSTGRNVLGQCDTEEWTGIRPF